MSTSPSGGGGAIPHSLHQHGRTVSSTGFRHDQHHTNQSSPLLHVDSMHQMDSIPTTAQLATPTQAEKSMSHMDHLPSDTITTANTASPPNHIRNMLLNQHHQQSGKGGGVITGNNPILTGHQSPGPPTHGMHTPPMGGGGDIHSGRGLSNEHLHSSNSSGIMHPPAPMSPVTPPSDNPSSVHNYGGWSYPTHQHAVLINESYAHGLPLLPTVQANTPTTQNHAFFKANY